MLRFLDEPISYSWVWPHDAYYSYRPKKNIWSESISVAGFDPNEITFKEEKSESGEIKILVHGRHETEDEFSEIRKSVKVPKNVDSEHLTRDITKDGLLVFKAPFKDDVDSKSPLIKLNREDNWGGIWNEIGRLNDQMNDIINIPRTLGAPRTEFLANKNGDSGVWRLKVNIGQDFQSEDIKLHHENGKIHLEAKKEIKGNNSISSRYFSEIVSLPEGIEEDKIHSKLLNNGELIIEAPCNKLPAIGKQKEGTVIPVEGFRSGGSDKRKWVMAYDK